MRSSKIIIPRDSLHQGWSNSMSAHSLTSAPASTAGRGRLAEFVELSGTFGLEGSLQITLRSARDSFCDMKKNNIYIKLLKMIMRY